MKKFLVKINYQNYQNYYLVIIIIIINRLSLLVSKKIKKSKYFHQKSNILFRECLWPVFFLYITIISSYPFYLQ